MGNMAYCRFENTARDLADCLSAIYDEGGIDSYIVNNDSSEYEIEGIKRLMGLVEELAQFDTWRENIALAEQTLEEMYNE